MSNFLTKEEIRQWRSSLERITLEEYAARLGKEVEEKKTTNDLIDIVKTNGTSSNTNKNIQDGFSHIAQRAFEREKQLSRTPFSINKKKIEKEIELIQTNKTDITDKIIDTKIEENQDVISEIDIKLKKCLTDREQIVFEYLLKNTGKTVYAKDIASLLNLPRDYVYKYIKNLRAKIEGDKLKNVPSGGFVLTK